MKIGKEADGETEREREKEKERPASVSKGDWSGNSTRIGLVGLNFRFDFGHIALPSRDSVQLPKNCLPVPLKPEKTALMCPNFYSENQIKSVKFSFQKKYIFP